MFYDPDTKQVRNRYEYSRDSRDSAGFGPSRHYTVPKLNNRSRIVKNTQNAARIGHELTVIRDDSRDFLSR